MNKYNEDTYHDKNKALDHIAKPSKLVAAAALSSKDKQHQLGAMNREDDDTTTELPVSNYNSAFNYNIGRLAGDCSRHTNPKVRKLLKDTAKSVGIDSASPEIRSSIPSSRLARTRATSSATYSRRISLGRTVLIESVYPYTNHMPTLGVGSLAILGSPSTRLGSERISGTAVLNTRVRAVGHDALTLACTLGMHRH